MADHFEIPVQNPEPIARILVVDDEEPILRMISLCLEQAGFIVKTACSAEKAYQHLDEDDFSTIVTDVMMPGEDGITFLSAIRRQRPDVPVIIMTGYAQLNMAVNAIKNGAFDFIHKPFDFIYFRKVVEKAVDVARLRRIEKQYRAELEEMVARRSGELKTALSQLEVARVRLLKAASDKSEFISTITHEMRTPMNGVIGALDLLIDEDLSGVQREYAQLARQSADNMMALVDQVLAFSDVSCQGPAMCFNTVDLQAVIDKVMQDHRPRFAGKGLSFDVQIAPDLTSKIRCDVEQLTSLLDILLGNALKFTDNGGVCLEVFIESNAEGAPVLHIAVTDTGIGIPPEMLERIFEPFTQVDGTLARRYGGVGLGLSIASQTAQLLNGRIWAECVSGGGSRFHFLMKV